MSDIYNSHAVLLKCVDHRICAMWRTTSSNNIGENDTNNAIQALWCISTTLRDITSTETYTSIAYTPNCARLFYTLFTKAFWEWKCTLANGLLSMRLIVWNDKKKKINLTEGIYWQHYVECIEMRSLFYHYFNHFKIYTSFFWSYGFA